MNIQLKFSRRLNLATLFCFMLPFFFYISGCDGQSPEEKAAAEEAENQRISDSVAAADAVQIKQDKNDIYTVTTTKSVDSTEIGGNARVDSLTIEKQNSDKKEKKSKSDQLSQTIVEKYPFLKPFLIPKENSYTGIAIIIDSLPIIYYVSAFISFLLLLLSLVIKMVECEAKRTIVILEIMAIFFLYIAEPTTWASEKLWGFGVALTFAFFLAFYDYYLMKYEMGKN